MTGEEAALVQYRLERAEQAIREAKLLLESGLLYGTVNRLYYACFYAVSALLMTEGHTSTKHSGIMALFDQHRMSDKLRQILTELKTRFQELYGERLVQIVLYGSQARGDAVEGSDIDVLVVLAGDVNPFEEISRTSDVVWRISLEHDVVVGCVFMDEERYRHRNGPLLRNIRREGVPI